MITKPKEGRLRVDDGDRYGLQTKNLKYKGFFVFKIRLEKAPERHSRSGLQITLFAHILFLLKR